MLSKREARKKKLKIEWQNSTSLETRVAEIIEICGFEHIRPNRVFCYASVSAQTRAYARIWGLSRVWQQTLGLEPAYILEVITEKFSKLSQSDQDKVLIHELLHIPKNFSGALVPHKHKGGVNEKTVHQIYKDYMQNKF